MTWLNSVPTAQVVQYCDWLMLFDAQVGAMYDGDDLDGEYHCPGCDASLPSKDARCSNPACGGGWDRDAEADLELHDALWPSGEYGNPNDPGYHAGSADVIGREWAHRHYGRI